MEQSAEGSEHIVEFGKKEFEMRQVSPKLQPWLKNFNQLLAELIANGFKPTPTNAREGAANLTKTLVTNIPDIAWCQDDLVHSRGCRRVDATANHLNAWQVIVTVDLFA